MQRRVQDSGQRCWKENQSAVSYQANCFMSEMIFLASLLLSSQKNGYVYLLFEKYFHQPDQLNLASYFFKSSFDNKGFLSFNTSQKSS